RCEPFDDHLFLWSRLYAKPSTISHPAEILRIFRYRNRLGRKTHIPNDHIVRQQVSFLSGNIIAQFFYQKTKRLPTIHPEIFKSLLRSEGVHHTVWNRIDHVADRAGFNCFRKVDAVAPTVP